MPWPASISTRAESLDDKRKDKYWIVYLDGITHIIVEKNFISKSISCRKLASEILDLFNFKQLKAAGVLFVKDSEAKIFLDPFIWIRDVKTFFNETACASGTTAIGLWQAEKRESSINNLEVVQPSKNSIFVTIERDNIKYINAWIKGPVKFLSQSALTLF